MLSDAGNRVMIVEAAFLDRARVAIDQAGAVEHLIVLDGPPKGVQLHARQKDGYLKIIDRKKELIINAAGKDMPPAKIDS